MSQQLIGFLYRMDICSVRYPIYNDTIINFPSDMLRDYRRAGKLIHLTVAKMSEKNDPFGDYIYINGTTLNDIKIKNINKDNGRKIIDFKKDEDVLIKDYPKYKPKSHVKFDAVDTLK